MLRSLSTLETQYLSRSSNKINESVGLAFSSGGRIPPGATEGTNAARTVANELDAARFDPLLVKAIAKSTATCLDSILSRVEGMVRGLWGFMTVFLTQIGRFQGTDPPCHFLGQWLHRNRYIMLT